MQRNKWLTLRIIAPAFLLFWAATTAGDMPDEFQNLQVLDPEISKDELKTIMNGFAKQLDVKCSYCHVVDKYHLDDNTHKRIARDMIRLVGYLRENRDTYFPLEKKKKNEVEEAKPEVLTCWMCHRGSSEVETFTPDEEEDW